MKGDRNKSRMRGLGENATRRWNTWEGKKKKKDEMRRMKEVQ